MSKIVAIVEDEPTLAESMAYEVKRLLNRPVRFFLNGGDFVPFFVSNFRKIDVVLLDLCLPDGNGADLIPTIKRKNHGIKIIVITANKKTKIRVDLLFRGVDDYLVKPINFTLLAAILRKRLGLLDRHIHDINKPYGSVGENSKPGVSINQDVYDRESDERIGVRGKVGRKNSRTRNSIFSSMGGSHVLGPTDGSSRDSNMLAHSRVVRLGRGLEYDLDTNVLYDLEANRSYLFTSREGEVLSLFVMGQGQYLGFREFSSSLGFIKSKRILASWVSRVNRKLKKASGGKLRIVCNYNVGYRLKRL